MARFLHLSDLHVVAEGAMCSSILDTRAILSAAVDVLLAGMDKLGPFDAVLLTGDISDDGSRESYDIALRELARLSLPIFAVPGNHDARAAFRSAFSKQAWMPATGPVNWIHDLEDTVLIGLDTLVEGQGGGRLAPESLSFLASALKGAAGRDVVVALHHPPLATGIRFMDGIGLENTASLMDAIPERSAPILFVAGHVHGVYLGRIGAHTVVTAPSICSAFGLDRRLDAPVGFFTGPTGFAILQTGAQACWTAQPLHLGTGPHSF